MIPEFITSILDGDEIADVLAYLDFMAGHKVCGGEKACE